MESHIILNGYFILIIYHHFVMYNNKRFVFNIIQSFNKILIYPKNQT